MAGVAPEWISERLQQLVLQGGEQGPHFEASYYGPIDGMADSIFSGSEYMVKPQAKIRPTAPPTGAGRPIRVRRNEQGPMRRSVDSYNAEVTDNVGLFEPDFLIVRVDTQRGLGGPQGDKIVACIEVKQDDSQSLLARHQLQVYLGTLDGKSTCKCPRGILILGKVTYEFNTKFRKMPTPGGEGLSTANDLEMVFRRLALKVEKEDKLQWRGGET